MCLYLVLKWCSSLLAAFRDCFISSTIISAQGRRPFLPSINLSSGPISRGTPRTCTDWTSWFFSTRDIPAVLRAKPLRAREAHRSSDTGKMFTLPLAVIVLVLCIVAYVLIRRYRQGGLGGGSAVLAAPQRARSMGSDRFFTEEEVATHNTQEDLWLIINGKVYDFTDYIALHPGGEAMLRNAGRDSTKGFSGSQHPARVWDMVSESFQRVYRVARGTSCEC
eukprot:TRINITY_DN156_c0_g3_i2.p1 TRINITY_DN156_c0_g3~~TRINITY_DN156_c0_g3_i2.p1  ORF type:complete len:222 (-),score=9.22 TRINITY_DN156_c0_g3_i2:483-1148(-)